MMQEIKPINLFAIAVVFVLALLVGCDLPDSSSGQSDAAACDTSESSDYDVGITPEQVDGTWIFSYTPYAWNDAHGEGNADIVEDCLMVRNMVVVWHSNQLDKARDLVAQVQAGENPFVELGGHEISLDEHEGDDDFCLPAEVLDRCPSVRSVWYSSDNEK